MDRQINGIDVSPERIHRDLFHLCSTPLTYRKANYTRDGQKVSTLTEADNYIKAQLQKLTCVTATTTHHVQAFRCDETKPIHHWYSTPAENDPWYEVDNIEASFLGAKRPDEIIQLISHKDSMSWIDSPGAHDNAAGTVANLEIARMLSSVELQRTVRILFCNEEHTPWTSRHAAEAAALRGDDIIAVLNVDSLDGKSDADMAEGRMLHTVTYSTAEGMRLANFIAECAEKYELELDVVVTEKSEVNDDDGMFINAGFRNTVMNVGSFPYTDSQYHLPGDVPERVSIENIALSTRLILAAVFELDSQGWK